MAQYDVNIRDYWRIVRKRKAIIIFAALMLGLFSTVGAILTRPTPIYRAMAKVRFQVSQVAESPFGRTVSYGSGLEDLDTEKQIITSYEVLERVAVRTGRLDTTSANPPIPKDKKEEMRINAILGLRGNIATETEGSTSIIDVSVTDPDPRVARDLTNAVVEIYREYNLETSNRQASKSRSFILGQRNSLRDSVAYLEQQIKDFRLRENMMDVASQTGMVLGRLNGAEEAMKQTQMAIQNIDRVLNNLQEGGSAGERVMATILPEEGGGVFAQLNAQLTDLNVRRNALLIDYTERHPQVRDLDARKQDVVRDMIQAIRNRREALRRQEQTQVTTVEEQKALYQELPALGLQLGNLEQQLRLKNELLTFYEREAQSAEIRNTEEVQEVEIIQRALLPGAPINPSTPTTTAAVGTALGMILGLVFAFIAETLDTSIGTIEDVEEYLQVSVVGIIPHIDIDEVKESLIRKGVSPQDTETLERRARLSAHFDPQSTLAESYRALRTNIQFVNVERGAKVIAVTSASSQEGKSITVANLAMTMAQAGNRVLLVDCDLRKPTIYRMFGLDREPGLTDVILGNYEWRDVVRTVTDIMTGGLGMEDIMLTPGMDNLNIITSGAIPPNPAEITDSRRMNEFIAQVREAYDIVLFDSPPILQATDATVLGTKVDGVLMVYRIGQISRGALRRAKLQMDNVNIPVLGIVLNGLRAEVSEDFQDLRYGTYYGYGSEQNEQTLKQKLLKKLKPALDRFQMVREWWGRRGDGDAAESVSPDTDEEPGWTQVAIKILAYMLLGSFILMGLLWQLGFFELPRRQERPLPPLKPGQEPKAKPSQPRAMLTLSALDAESETAVAKDYASAVRAFDLPAAPSISSEVTDGARPSGDPLVGSSEKRTASDARPDSPRVEHRFAVQIGAYREKSRVSRVTERLRKAGYTVRTMSAGANPGEVLTRVMIVGFDSPQAAGGIAHRLRRIGLTNAVVVEAIEGPVDPTAENWANIDNDADARMVTPR